MALALADFRERVAQDIGLLGEGVPFSAADDQLITSIYTDVYYELDVERIVDWGVSEAIPNEYVGALVDLVGARVAPKFRLPPRDGVPWTSSEEIALKRLKKLIARPYQASTTPSTYF